MEHFNRLDPERTRTVQDSVDSLAPGWATPVARVTTVALATLLAAGMGCAAQSNTFQVVDHRAPGAAQTYRETFDEAYFDLDQHGNVDLVLRRGGATNPGESITQVIHIKSFWRSIPGETVANRSQINATVVYHIVVGRTGETFEGAGSVFFRHNRKKDVLTGSLDLAFLRPTRELVAGNPLFHRAELSGHFRAIRNPRRVVRIVNDMNQLFGLMPPPRTTP